MAHERLLNVLHKEDDVSLTYGSCLCGSIKYTLSGAPSTTVLCHCISCKKSSGSAFKANGFYQASQLNITSSAENLKTYVDKSPDSGVAAERIFCSECGSRLFIRNPKYPNAVIVSFGTLDLSEEELKKWKPESEFYCKRKGDWLVDAGSEVGKKFMGME